MLKKIKNWNRDINILRKYFWEFSVDAWFSKKFEHMLIGRQITLEEFFKDKIEWIEAVNKNVYVFLFIGYDKLNSFIEELEEEWHRNIKLSDIYIYVNDEIKKYI